MFIIVRIYIFNLYHIYLQQYLLPLARLIGKADYFLKIIL